jgi:hypothetical protein
VRREWLLEKCEEQTAWVYQSGLQQSEDDVNGESPTDSSGV